MGSSSFFSSAVFFAAASSSSAGALNSTSLLTSSALPSVALTGLQCGEPSYSFADFVFGRLSLLLLNTISKLFFFVLSLFVNNGRNSTLFFFSLFLCAKICGLGKLCVKVSLQQRFFTSSKSSSPLLVILL